MVPLTGPLVVVIGVNSISVLTRGIGPPRVAVILGQARTTG